MSKGPRTTQPNTVIDPCPESNCGRQVGRIGTHAKDCDNYGRKIDCGTCREPNFQHIVGCPESNDGGKGRAEKGGEE